MPVATAQPAARSAQTLQGQIVPENAINGVEFFRRTRRKRAPEAVPGGFAGFGNTNFVELKKSDIISALHVRFSGTLAITHNTGTVAATFRWPYDLLKSCRFTANGQSNVVSVSGAKLKVREVAANPDADDRGVIQSVSGANVQQGTLAFSSESWGVGPGQSAIATGNYAVELYWRVPVSEDEKDLSGAIFAQTTAMDLTLTLDWNTLAVLFTVTGNDVVALTGNVYVESEKFSIPSVNGLMILPEGLSVFHSLVQTPIVGGIGQGDNEVRMMGQGPGKTLLRIFYQTWQGATPAPLAVTGANYGPQGWRYGSNETPEIFQDGRSLRQWNEDLYGVDIAAVWGFLCHDFATTWAFRDTVDQGATSDLRLYVNYASALTNPTLEYVQEWIYPAGSAA